MKAMAALSPQPSRAPTLPSDAAPSDGDSQRGAFAAALGQAREPAKAALDRPAKTQPTPGRPKPALSEVEGAADAPSGGSERSERGGAPQANAASTADPTSQARPVTAPESSRGDSAMLEEPPATEVLVAPDAAMLLPGWPASPAVAAMGALAAALPSASSAVPVEAQAEPDATPEGSTGAVTDLTRAPRHAAATALAALVPAGPAPSQRSPAAASAASAPAATDSAATTAAKPGADTATTPALTPGGSSVATPLATAAPQTAAAASPAAATPFAAHLAAAVNSPAFAPALATQVNWLVQEGLQLARLTLHPAEMGPVAVKIVLDGTLARIDFSAAIASTRAAIEASLPTLAAALHDSGLTLAGGGVSDGQARQGAQADRSPRTPNPGVATGATSPPAETNLAPALRTARGLVDLVA